MWKNTVQPDRPQMITWRMRIACWIPKATNTHTTQIVQCSFHWNKGCTKASQCYVIRTLPVVLFITNVMI